jgi:hypothetical protein
MDRSFDKGDIKMTAGISRVHGLVLNPKNFAGVSLQDFTLTFWSGDVGTALAADAVLANGALDQAFRTALETVGTISRVGELNTSSRTVRFAVESLGFDGDNNGNGFLGTEPDNEIDGITTTAGALQAAINGLGTVNGIHLTSATVVKFVY